MNQVVVRRLTTILRLPKLEARNRGTSQPGAAPVYNVHLCITRSNGPSGARP